MIGLAEATTTRQRRYQRAVERLIAQRDQLADRQVRALSALLADTRQQVRQDLLDLAPASVTNFQAHHLRQLQAAIDRLAVGLVRRARPLFASALDSAWEAGERVASASLEAVGLTLPGRLIDRTALLLAQETAAELVPQVGARFRLRARQALVRGVLGAASPHAVTAEIAGLLRAEPTRAGKKPGTIAYEAATIMRTEMMGAFNQADAARTGELVDAVPGLRKWWDSASDKRVRPDHAAAEARYRPGGSEGPIALTADFVVGGERAGYPHDPRLSGRQRNRCRCVRMLWHPDWEG